MNPPPPASTHITPLRYHYWSPRREGVKFVDKTTFLYPFHLEMDAGCWSDWHSHDGFGEIFYWEAGLSVLCTGQQNFVCNPLHAIWIPPGVEHEWYLPQPASDRSIFVHTSAVTGRRNFEYLHMIEVSPLLKELLTAVTEKVPDFSSEKGQRLGMVLLDCFEDSRNISSPLTMPYHHRLVELCSQAILSPDESIPLEEWSDKLHLSSRSLTRIFRRETGVSMGQWVKFMRMLHARELMENGQCVTTAALDSGYTSVSAFIHAFKKSFGHTPGSVRKKEPIRK